jgi:hypothetical protein
METKEREIQVGKITFVESQEPSLPSIPVAVAVARCIGRPVRCAEIVPVEHPDRLCWAQFEPVSRTDPFLPVPLAEFGQPLWDWLRRWGQHFMRWSPRANQRDWGSAGLEIVEGLARFLAGFAELRGDERAWLQAALWRSYAQPQGMPELLAADTRENRLRRQTALEQARLRMQLERPPAMYAVPGDRPGDVKFRYR